MGMLVVASRARAEAVVDEATLVAGVRAGEAAAYEDLIRIHGPRMLGVARHYFRDESDARDAVQDALVNVCRGVAGFDGRSRLSTWLHRVVVNAALSRLRTRRRHPESLLDDLAAGASEATATAFEPAAPERTEEAASCREARSRVRASIERLPADYRGVVILRDLEGLDVSAAGDLLDLTTDSAKMRLHRGRRALRRMLDGFARDARTR